MTMRTVTLELLRHGPAHNQLLSPLTPYLALCGNHPAETVHVGFEHLQFHRYLEHLRPSRGRRPATLSTLDATREVSRLLESIRALTAELASSDPEEGQRMVHLRLVISASELALLPFELATSITGMPGQGQPLSLQTVSPLCLTREVRRVATTTFQWPHQPRILMVSASPRANVPEQEHEEQLLAALTPYVEPGQVDKHLTVLREATLEHVREACTRDTYTHVHILAHGIKSESTDDDTRYGLAFHPEKGSQDDVDVVSGERLASALRCHLRDKAGQALSSPTVVSIASCESGNVGSVMAPGASVAHALHEQGIPLVIGSQFPLSTKGSILLTELLYRRLLSGDDPRVIVHDMRQALLTACPHNHDWASVVVYAALPSNLKEQLQQARFEQARRALDVVMRRVSKSHFQEMILKETAAPPSQEMTQHLLEAMDRFEATSPQSGSNVELVKAWGVLASAWKQVASLLSIAIHRAGEDKPLLQDKGFRDALEKARHYYYECYRIGASEAWPLVQYLALTVGLGLDEDQRTGKTSRRFKQRWAAAVARAEDNLEWGTHPQKVWAHSSLAELAILSMKWRDPRRCTSEARQHVERVLEFKDMRQYSNVRFDVTSLKRQLEHYESWDWGTKEMRDLGEELATLLEHGT
jgi:hypothetical protein